MRKKIITIVTIICALSLSACGNTTDITKERIINKEVYFSKDNDINDVIKYGNIDLLFKSNSTVPYISLKDGLSYINMLRKEAVNSDYVITYKQEKDTATYSAPNNAYSIIDIKEQTITYHDYSGLLNHIHPYKDTYALFAPNKDSSIHLLSNDYKVGNDYIIDLKKYSEIDIYQHDGYFYLPLTTYNDLFISPLSLCNLVYNFDKVYFLSSEAKYTVTDEEGEEIFTPLGKLFYTSKEENPTVDKQYASYYYQNICLSFDYLYGVKGLKGRNYDTFDNYLSTKGYKEDLLSGDVKKMDAAYAYALSTFYDFHTGIGAYSSLYEYGSADIERSKFNPEMAKEEEEEEELNAARKASKAELGFSIDTENRIAYIAFNRFDPVDERALAKDTYTEEDLNNSVTLFAYAYKEIVNKYLASIDYVAIDLATNNGGSSDGMIYMLNILLGQVSIDIQNPFSKDNTRCKYALDINRDGKVDEKDISLREYGKQIVFINTHFAFSCGNALPVYAKYNYPEQVTTIGETTGGGTCALRVSYNALGTKYHLSGFNMLSKKVNDKLDNIEMGVAPDIPLENVADTINRNTVVKALLRK